MTGRLLFPDDPTGPVDNPTVCLERSMTRQSEAAGCDINEIMKRYEKTGVLPVSSREAVFTDVSEVGSFREALEVIQRAQEGFMELPAKVRARFENDALAFVEYCQDPSRTVAELEDLGLVEKAAEAVAPTAPVAP